MAAIADEEMICGPCQAEDHLYCSEGDCECECRMDDEEEIDTDDDGDEE